jgi:hypothetical protein
MADERKAVPRKKPKGGSRDAASTWYSRSFTFPFDREQKPVDPEYEKELRKSLAGYVMLPPESEAFVEVLHEVGRVLAQHHGVVQAVDNAPRPSDYTNS